MPVLHLRLTGPTNEITLQKELPAQHLRLKMYSVSFANGNYTGDCVKLSFDTDFISHGINNNYRNDIQDHKLSLFTQNDVYNRRTAYYPDLSMKASGNIQKSFIVRIFQEDGTTLFTDADLTALHLYFEYDNEHKDGD